MHFTRRNLLRALGLAGPAYFLPWRGDKLARAADPTIPTRVLFFYTPHGTLFRQWVRPAAGATAPTETAFELGPILQPLQPYKSKLLLLEGLDMQSTYVDPINAANGHIGGQTHSLSAINRANANAAGGISIDEFIAQGLNTPAPVTALPILELSARGNAGSAAFSTSWAGSNMLVPPMTDPGAVYARMFPNGPPASMPTQAQLDAAAAAQRKKSILDGVLAEFNAVKQPLSAADKSKLDTHASLIRDLEARVSLMPATTCAAPNQASVTAPYKMDCPYGAGDNCIQDAASAFIQLAVSALACDITRVITLDIDQLNSTMFGVDDIHAFLHGMDDVSWFANDHFGTSSDVSATAKDQGNIDTAVKFYSSYAQMMANLLQQLDAIQEPDGSTLLDHTIVVWCGEIGSSNHTNFMVNYVLAGGGGGFLKTGRYLSLPRTKPTKYDADYYVNAGLPHSNLFVSLANAMGLSNVTTFGNPVTCTGPLTQLRG